MLLSPSFTELMGTFFFCFRDHPGRLQVIEKRPRLETVSLQNWYAAYSIFMECCANHNHLLHSRGVIAALKEYGDWEWKFIIVGMLMVERMWLCCYEWIGITCHLETSGYIAEFIVTEQQNLEWGEHFQIKNYRFSSVEIQFLNQVWGPHESIYSQDGGINRVQNCFEFSLEGPSLFDAPSITIEVNNTEYPIIEGLNEEGNKVMVTLPKLHVDDLPSK